MENVPWHEEVVEFVQQLAELLHPDYEVASEHAHSNCVLLAHTKVWNSLPTNFTASAFLPSFNRQLKSFSFTKSFPLL